MLHDDDTDPETAALVEQWQAEGLSQDEIALRLIAMFIEENA